MPKPLFSGPEGVCFPITQTTVTRWDGSKTVVEPRGSEEGLRVGEDVRQMIAEALAKPSEESRVRALGECCRRFPSETKRHPEVCAYLEQLSERQQTSALTRILGDRPRRGRPSRCADDEFVETAIVQGIVQSEHCSVAKAAEIARRNYRQLSHKTARAIENDFSRTRDAYRAWREHRWIPGNKLTDAPWSRSR